jgi:hypothetical protein
LRWCHQASSIALEVRRQAPEEVKDSKHVA